MKNNWEEELIGFNDRGIVEYSDGSSLLHFSNPSAICMNCGKFVIGKKAQKMMLGHIGCPKPNGEYVKNDMTPEKLKKVISRALSSQLEEIEEMVNKMRRPKEGRLTYECTGCDRALVTFLFKLKQMKGKIGYEKTK